MDSLSEFLTWLLSSGGSAIAASWIFERIPWFQAQESEKKKWIFFGASTLISIISYLVITFVPKEVLDSIAPYFAILAGAFYNVFFGTAFHSKVNKGQ